MYQWPNLHRVLYSLAGGWKVFSKIQVWALITLWCLYYIFRSGQIAHSMPIGRVLAYKTSKTSPIFWARTFCFIKMKKKKKTLKRSTSFQSIRYNNERVTVNFKYLPTCNILIKFNYLKISELLYLLMDWETIN